MERRKKYRVKTRIFLLKPDDESEKASEAKIINIGPNGAFIRADDLLPVGTRMTLVFRLPGRIMKFKVPAVVRWLRDGRERGYGVEFTTMSKRTREGLAKWVLKKYLEAMT